MNAQNQTAAAKRQITIEPGLCSDAPEHSDVSPAIVQMAEREAEHRAVRRHARIAEAAYSRAEKRGFEAGHELEDWLEAELEVEAARRMTVLCPSDALTPAERASWAGRRN